MVQRSRNGERIDSRQTHRAKKHRPYLLIILAFLLFSNLGYFWYSWHRTNNLASQEQKNTSAISKVSGLQNIEGWVADYVHDNAITNSDVSDNGTLSKWVDQKITARMNQSTLSTPLPATTTPQDRSIPQQPQTSPAMPAANYTAGNGIIIDGLQISAIPTTSIDGNDVTSHSLPLNSLADDSCGADQVLKFSGTDWQCGIDEVASLTGSGAVTNRLAVFSSSSTLGSSYLAQDSSGLTIDGGKDLHVGGTVFGNGSGLYNLDGLAVQTGSIPAAALGDNSITTRSVANGSITGDKLADGSVDGNKLASGVVTLTKLANSGCASGEIPKWNGLIWACAADNDHSTTYTAGGGLALNNRVLSLDTNGSNTWAAAQVFGGGVSVGGNTYTDLAGSGLQISGGILSSTLGTSIATNELEDGAVTSDKLADGAVSLSKLGQNGCAAQQSIVWNGSEWTCASDASPTYTAGNGLTLASGAFELDPSSSTTWTGNQTFNGGLTVGGNSYTNLAGSGLSFSGGVLSSALGTSIATNELEDGAVTSDKLADGAVSLAKLSSSCSNGQIIKWNGSAWACAADDDHNTTYIAGGGLSFSNGTFSLDTAANNNWSGLQSFGGGLNLNGNTYTDLAGSGLSFSGGMLTSVLGTSIGTSKLEDGSVTAVKIANGTIGLDKLGQNGCALNQVIKWNGSAWACADVDTTAPGNTTAPTYTAGAGLAVNNNAFSLDSTHSNDWSGLQTFSGGIALGGNTYTNLAGSGLSFSGGVLSTTLGDDIQTAEIQDGAVTSSKLAPGVVTLDKIGQSGCAGNDILRWSGSSWSCSQDSDTNTTYSAGSGLSLSGTSFAVDFTHANAWSGAQTFDGGITLGGNTYTNLAGSGLSFSGGTLSASLGTSIESNEITDGAITSAKILDGTIASDDLANQSVTASKLSQNGCTNGQVLKWQTSTWTCASDIDTDTNTTYSAGDGLNLDSGTNTFSINTASTNTWSGTQNFSNGFTLGGSTYTNLAGTGLSFNSGVLSAALGTSIETAEITTGAVTNSKLAGSIGLDKIGQNGCTTSQTIKWSGTAWVCGNDNDTVVSYTAGSGLSLTGNTLSLNTANANTWSANQTFSAGLTVGGNTYTNLAGTGLTFSSGVLSSSLGTSIESGEITDGTIATVDLGDSTITSNKIVDGTIISADLADSVVTSAKILDGTITGADIASGTITAANIADGTLTGNKLADGTITAAKLGTAARKRVVTANIPSILISVLSTQEIPVFVAPTNGTITKVTFTSGNNVVAVSNGGTISVERKTATAGTVASVNLSSVSMTALAPTSPALNAGTTFSTGDVYTFKYAPGLVGLALNTMLVTIEYTAND